ncbi:MAG: hypothetical protein QF400_03810, partial [Candidatus Peribacteraceae bacterium]|nr:hypothetical protein [Candidatus Peribacteraceae bacterium]
DSIAAEKSLREVTDGVWMKVDGIEYSYGFDREQTNRVDGNFDAEGKPYRAAIVGRYCHNNGRLAYVDGNGHVWVGACTDENFTALDRAGYQPGSFFVPFSNGERPTNQQEYERLRDVCTGKHPEQLHEERSGRVDELLNQRRTLFAEVANMPDREALFQKVADRREWEPTHVSDIVAEKCNTRQEQDDSSALRSVYTFNGATFSFRGREEMPIYETASQSNTTVLGEQSLYTEPEVFSSYTQKLAEHDPDSPQHFAASKTLLGVVELAIRLGSKDESLSKLRGELAEGKYSERALAIIDAITACDYLEYGEFEGKPTCDGEALVVLALLGDKDAQNAVANKVESLRYFEQQQREHQAREQSLDRSEAEPLNPEELCVVHATQYKPENQGDGKFAVRTTFDATKGNVPRNSIHTTLNHKVESHMYGSWEGAGYVLVSPFNDMVQSNDVPAVLNTVDTYWTCNPGESLEFSNAVLIAPAGDTGETLFQSKGDTVEFKSEGFGLRDLKETREMLTHGREEGALDRDIESTVFDYFQLDFGKARDDFDCEAATQHLGDYFYDDSNRQHTPAILLKLIDCIGDESSDDVPSISEVLQDLLVEAGMKDCVTSGDQDSAVSKAANELAEEVGAKLVGHISRIATNHAISEKGFSVKSGGMWAWGDSFDVTHQTHALASKLGILSGAHTGQVDSQITDSWQRAKFAATEGDKENAEFDWKKFDPALEKLIPELDGASRRMLYASGLLNAASRSHSEVN